MSKNSMNLERIKIRLPELEAAWQHKTDATESYNDAIKHVAEENGVEPGALKAYVNASMRDKLQQIEREAEQLTLMLDTFSPE